MLNAMERFPHMAPYNWLVYTFTQDDYEPLIALITKEAQNFTGTIAEESIEIICLDRDYEQGRQFKSSPKQCLHFCVCLHYLHDQVSALFA